MTQRILEPGQIEKLASRSIPRVKLPHRATVFAHRAARLRALAPQSSIGDYLRVMANVADAQQLALNGLNLAAPDAESIDRAYAHGMPPLHAPTISRDGWIDTLHQIVDAVSPTAPAGVADICRALRNEQPASIDAQAAALFEQRNDNIDAATAPFINAALQVRWTSMTSAFSAERVAALDIPGICPLCGTLPVASLVRARAPYQGYRYLHCALCETEWHMVRVHCSTCGADGKHLSYQTLQATATDDASDAQDAAVRAEVCDVCRSYRKILYQEKDIDVEPVADDLATLTLDILLAEENFHRGSGNPLLWQPLQA